MVLSARGGSSQLPPFSGQATSQDALLLSSHSLQRHVKVNSEQVPLNAQTGALQSAFSAQVVAVGFVEMDGEMVGD